MKNVVIFWDKDNKSVTISFNPADFNYSWHGDFENYLSRLKTAVFIFNLEMYDATMSVETKIENIILKVNAEDIISVEDDIEYANITFISRGWQYTLTISYINGRLGFAVKYMESYGLFD